MTCSMKTLISMLIFISFFQVNSSFAQAIEAAATEQSVHNNYLDIWEKSPAVKLSLTSNELSVLYKEVANNPVSQLASLDKYDPQGVIGFCFGRAMAAQLLARKMGLVPESIQKLFVIGALCSKCKKPEDKSEWRFHVATLVRGPKQEMYVIDPIYPHDHFKPVTVAQWVEFIRKGWDSYHNGKPKAFLYLTDATAVLPNITTLPNPESGELIIELNFDPEKHAIAKLDYEELKNTYGLTHGDVTLYQLSEAQKNNLMLTAQANNNIHPFSYLDIHINDMHITYNNYFVDLLNSFSHKVTTPELENSASENKTAYKLMSPIELSFDRNSENRSLVGDDAEITAKSSVVSKIPSAISNSPSAIKNLPLGFALERLK